MILYRLISTRPNPKSQNKKTEAENEINNNFDLYKDKIHKYTYTFEKIDDIYKIVSLSFK